MELMTSVEIPAQAFLIEYKHRLMLMGSCFAQNMGEVLYEHKFDCLLNPYGILYNPLSISTALRQITDGSDYTPDRLIYDKECYHSLMHHGSFSSADLDETLDRINKNIRTAHALLPRLDCLLLTFGTAWVYTYKKDGRLASNCHKFPATDFVRRRLTVEEIVNDYSLLIASLSRISPKLKIIFTVSPVRHVKDGMHQNQLSKSVLLLAIDRLVELFPAQTHYFPAYEILMDELRDYRFYADDMLHPSPLALQYIWQRFSDVFFSGETKKIFKSIDEIRKGLLHRPLYENSAAYQQFLAQIVLKINRLNEINPNFDFQNELKQCLIQSNKLQA